jgi:hypothetical protein
MFIDQQVERLAGDDIARPPLISYLRYDVELERPVLAELGMNFSEKEINSLKNMSNVKNISELDEIGIAAAANEVREEHFPPGFDRNV